MNSPHFLGYSGYAEETTLGMKSLREQLRSCQSSMASVLTSVVASLHQEGLPELYWRLRGPNQWPTEKMYQASAKYAQS